MSDFDFSAHTPGDVVVIQCCDHCCYKHGVRPKSPPDSGLSSWMCGVCGHYGIGSRMECEVGQWLNLRPIAPWDGKS